MSKSIAEVRPSVNSAHCDPYPPLPPIHSSSSANPQPRRCPCFLSASQPPLLLTQTLRPSRPPHHRRSRGATRIVAVALPDSVAPEFDVPAPHHRRNRKSSAPPAFSAPLSPAPFLRIRGTHPGKTLPGTSAALAAQIEVIPARTQPAPPEVLCLPPAGAAVWGKFNRGCGDRRLLSHSSPSTAFAPTGRHDSSHHRTCLPYRCPGWGPVRTAVFEPRPPPASTKALLALQAVTTESNKTEHAGPRRHCPSDAPREG